MIIFPTACPECLFGEIRGGMVYCRHYRESTLLDYDKRPEYCRVEKITIEEGEE